MHCATCTLETCPIFGHILCRHKTNILLLQYPVLCRPHHGLTVNHKLPTTAALSWAPPPECGSEVTGYSVEVVGPNSTQKQEISIPGADVNSVEVTKLTPSTTYTFKVHATSRAGTGPVAIISSTTPSDSESTSY